jgi:hypothetical protein
VLGWCRHQKLNYFRDVPQQPAGIPITGSTFFILALKPFMALPQCQTFGWRRHQVSFPSRTIIHFVFCAKILTIIAFPSWYDVGDAVTVTSSDLLFNPADL